MHSFKYAQTRRYLYVFCDAQTHGWGCGLCLNSMVTSHTWIPASLILRLAYFHPHMTHRSPAIWWRLIVLPLFSGNEFVYLFAHCYYLHISFPILRKIYLTSCAVGEQNNCVSFTVVTTSGHAEPQLLILSYRLWTAWEVCGAIYCHKEANQSPRSDTGFTLPDVKENPLFWCHMKGDHMR